MMTLNSKKTVCKIGLRMPFLSLISFLYICSLIICFVFISTPISRNAFAGEKAWLGVQVQSMAMPGADGVTGGRRSRATSISGLLVVGVAPGSPAEKMGLRRR
jgi:hypothetical protein